MLLQSLSLVILSQLLGTAFGIECYECTGQKGLNTDCEINLSNTLVRNCTPGFLCTLYINTDRANVTTVNRLCSPNDECEIVKGTNSHVMDEDKNRTIDVCYSCSTDLCNDSGSLFTFASSLTSVILSTMCALSFNAAYNI